MYLENTGLFYRALLQKRPLILRTSVHLCVRVCVCHKVGMCIHQIYMYLCSTRACVCVCVCQIIACVCVCVCHIVCICIGHRVGTGWRRRVGSLKLQVIFRKRATNYRALLRKTTYKDKTSYDSKPACKSKQTRLKSLGVLSYIC